MALKATIYKAELQISDLDRHYYQTHTLTLARHPSENDIRMMVRLLAFVLNADERLAFTKGLSTQDEPDLWRHSLSDEIELWVELGQPDEKRLRKAAGRAQQVVVYVYSGRSAAVWWEQHKDKLSRFENLAIWEIDADQAEALAALAQRTMRLQATVQDGEVYLGDESGSNVQITPRRLR